MHLAPNATCGPQQFRRFANRWRQQLIGHAHTSNANWKAWIGPLWGGLWCGRADTYTRTHTHVSETHMCVDTHGSADTHTEWSILDSIRMKGLGTKWSYFKLFRVVRWQYMYICMYICIQFYRINIQKLRTNMQSVKNDETFSNYIIYYI